MAEAKVERVRSLRAPAAAASAAERQRAEARFGAVAESVRALFEDMQLSR